MAITLVGVKHGGRGGGVGNNWARKYSTTYVVETDSVDDGVQAVLTAVDPTTGLRIPYVGNTYALGNEVDTASWCQSVEAKEDDDGNGVQWTVTAEFAAYDPTAFSANPTEWPLRVEFSAATYDRVVWFDVNGDPILNSAHDRFDDPLTRDESRVLIIVTRNELVRDFAIDFASTYNDKINSDTWNGFAPYSVKIGAITSGQPQTGPDGSVYYAVTYPFAIDRNLWRKTLLDQGLAELDNGSPARQKPILDADGQPVGEAVPLNGSGKRLATNATPVSLDFDILEEIAFSGLNLNLALRYGA